MIPIPNPSDKKLYQSNRSDVFGIPAYNPMLGNLWSTFNIDLQEVVGTIRVGNRMKIQHKASDSGLSNMGVPTAFTPYSGIWCLAGSRIYQAVGGTMIEDNTTSARTDWSSENDDMITFNQTPVCTNQAQGKVYYISSLGAWTAGPTITNGSYNNQLVYFKKFDQIYLMSGVRICGINRSWAIATTGTPYCVELDASPYNTGGDRDDGFPHCIAAGSDKIWFGTMRSNGAGSWDNGNPGTYCSVYEWDGISNQVTRQYKIPAQGVMSIVIKNDIPIIFDSEGVLRKFDGTGFVGPTCEIGRLPLKRNQQLRFTWSYTGGNRTQNFIHPKGLCISKDDTILALINGNSVYDSNNIIENLPSGIWEFDGKGSAVHRNSLSLLPQTSTSLTDYGQNKLALIGSLVNIKTSNLSVGESKLWCGAQFYTTASATDYGVFSDAPSPTNNGTYPEGQKYGYFVSTWLSSQQATDMWRKAFLAYSPLLNSTDKIIVKYRNKKNTPLYETITWVNTTSFTVSGVDLSGYIGYEVEIVQGVGGGQCSHIVTAVYAGGTSTVTVDETYTGATTTTAVARIQNWNKAGTVTDQVTDVAEFPTTDAGDTAYNRIQIKVCMQFTGDNEVHQLSVVSSPQQPLA